MNENETVAHYFVCGVEGCGTAFPCNDDGETKCFAHIKEHGVLAYYKVVHGRAVEQKNEEKKGHQSFELG